MVHLAPGLCYNVETAIHVAGGDYLRYCEREYGINLDWLSQPAYEWELRKPGPPGHQHQQQEHDLRHRSPPPRP